MARVRGEGAPYKIVRKKKRKNKKTGEVETYDYVMWEWQIELDPKPNGERQHHTIRRKSRNDLIAARREIIKKIADGEKLKQDKTTFGAWLADTWLPDYAQPSMKPRAFKNYESMARRYVVPTIGGVKLVEMEPDHVRLVLAAVRKAGLSASSAETAYYVMKKAMDDAWASRRFGLRENVVALVPTPSRTKGRADAPEKEATGRGRVSRSRKPLTTEQARTLIQHARTTGDPYAVRWAVAMWLGIRQGETLGLTVDRVDLDAGLIDTSWALQETPLLPDPTTGKRRGRPARTDYPAEWFKVPLDYEYRPLWRTVCLIRPKTARSTRVVPIPEPLLVLLRAHIASMPANPWGLLWVEEVRGEIRPVDHGTDTERWSAALAAAKLPDSVLHAARHTTATLLQEAGVPEDVRIAIMGHNSAAAQREYAHAGNDFKREHLSKLNLLQSADEPSR